MQYAADFHFEIMLFLLLWEIDKCPQSKIDENFEFKWWASNLANFIADMIMLWP